MQLKMIYERKVSKELLGLKYKARKEIEEEYGKNSRRTRNMMKNLRKEAAKVKKEAMMKYEQKMKHLRRKFRTDEEDKMKKVPEALDNLGLEGLSIFSEKKFVEIKAWDYEVKIIGDLDLSDNERMILRLPPKFAIEENLPEDGMSFDEELAFAKARMTINKEEEEKIDEEDEGVEENEEEEMEREKDEARSRQTYVQG